MEGAIGEPLVPKRSARCSATEPNRKRVVDSARTARRRRRAADRRSCGVVRAGRRGEGEALRPFHLDRRQRRGTAGRESRPARRCRLRRSPLRPRVRPCARTAPAADGSSSRHEIDRAGDGGAQAVDREARDAPDAGVPAVSFAPVVLLAGAERGHDAHAGDGDDGPAARCRDLRVHAASSAASTSARPSPRQWPQPVTSDLERSGSRIGCSLGFAAARTGCRARDRGRGEREIRRELRLHRVAECRRRSRAPAGAVRRGTPAPRWSAARRRRRRR